MLVVKIVLIATLAAIFLQDIKERRIYWWLFPLLAISLLAERGFSQYNIQFAGRNLQSNLAFLLFQIAMASIYLRFRFGNWKAITDMAGLGDLLIFICISLVMPFLNFFVFYLFSMVLSLLGWLAWKFIANSKNNEIPVAGLVALIFAALLSAGWYDHSINLIEDSILLQFIAP